MATNKSVIEFLRHACPTVLDLTEDSIKIIEKDKELMSILRYECTDMERGHGDVVGKETNLAAYQSMGWYLAEILRQDIQNYYSFKYGIGMATFLRKKYGDEIKPERHMYLEHNKKWAKINYKKYFGRELKLDYLNE